MAKSRSIHVPGQNCLVAGLPKPEQDRLLASRLEPVKLSLKETLYDANAPITHVFFPLSGVMSLVVITQDGRAVEVGTIGNEGMVGTPLFLAADRSPTRALAQIPGEALRMRAELFHDEMRQGGVFHQLIQRYTQGMVNQISQTVACNHLHSIEQRMCRWLLLTHDRVGTDDFPLTQEFLAQMLGVRRPSVTVVAGILQNAGLISYRRGRITIVDRSGLEGTSCECYEVVKKEFQRLLGSAKTG